ncbi:DNA (cytosine-5-)-methyltransferase [Corynebacterium efficiens YS-314]|nr:DNA methyltransferase [Corynebacterium efficiens]EEW51368.1 DNA (cytosine-5-)-methyltransferase [Corynebacterium efficiens YS-314]
MLSKTEAFQSSLQALKSAAKWADEEAIVTHGDSLQLMKRLPDNSVSLILTDPPYHSTKKENILGDTAFGEDDDFIAWMVECAKEWKRVLRPNGTLYVFCSSEMSARLEVNLAQFFRPIGHITWSKPNLPGYDGWKGKMKKEALRSWYPHSERILVFEHGTYGALEARRRSPMGIYLRDCRLAAGLSMVALTEATGAYGKINRGGAVANWEAGRNIPSREQYAKLRKALLETGRVDSMVEYEDLVRPMFLSGDVEYTDVWDFPSVKQYKGKHPAEKPVALLRHIIAASSYPGDVVLDSFAGSGSTAVAAITEGRRAITMELEDKWVERTIHSVQFASFSFNGIESSCSLASSSVEISTGTLFDV